VTLGIVIVIVKQEHNKIPRESKQQHNGFHCV